MKFETKDNAPHTTYPTGAKKEVAGQGKGRYDLIPPAALKRLAQLYERGAVKYSDRNWEKGIPFHRLIDSLLRHANQWLAGECDEDHLAAVAWNAFALMHHEEQIVTGNLPVELADIREAVEIDSAFSIDCQLSHFERMCK